MCGEQMENIPSSTNPLIFIYPRYGVGCAGHPSFTLSRTTVRSFGISASRLL